MINNDKTIKLCNLLYHIPIASTNHYLYIYIYINCCSIEPNNLDPILITQIVGKKLLADMAISTSDWLAEIMDNYMVNVNIFHINID